MFKFGHLNLVDNPVVRIGDPLGVKSHVAGAIFLTALVMTIEAAELLSVIVVMAIGAWAIVILDARILGLNQPGNSGGRRPLSEEDECRRNHLAILGLDEGAGSEDIRASYRKIAILHHPDQRRGDRGGEAELARATRAYRSLLKSSGRSEARSGVPIFHT